MGKKKTQSPTKAQEQLTDPQPELYRQFDDEWCLLNPDGSKGECFPTKEEAEAAARKAALESDRVSEKIVKKGDEYCVMSEDGSKSFGCYSTEEEALERLGQIEHFKTEEQRDPEAVCGEIWFNGTDEQRAAFGSTEGRGRDEKPPKKWFDTCVLKIQDSKKEPAKESKSLVPFLARESLTGRFTERGPLDEEGKVWEVVLIKAGMSKNGRLYTREVLRDAVERKIFEGLPAFAFVYRTPDGLILDHAPDGVKTSDFPKDVAGFYKNVRFDEAEGAVVGEFHFVDPILQQKHKEAFDAGNKNLFGLSIDAIGEGQELTKDTVEIKYFVRANSDDLVSHPAAGGRFVRMVASMARRKTLLKEDGTMDKKKLLLQLIMEVKPALLEGKDTEKVTQEELEKMIEGEEFAPIRKAFAELAAKPEQTPAPATTPAPAPKMEPAAAAVETAKLVNEAVAKAMWPGKVEGAIREAKITGEAEKLVRDLAEKAVGDEAHLKACVGRAQKLLESAGWQDPKITSATVKEGVEKKWQRAIEASISGKPGKDGVPAFRDLRHALQAVTGRAEWSIREMMEALNLAFGRVCAQWNDRRDGNVEAKPLTEAYDARVRESLQGRRMSVKETINLAQFTELFGDSVTRQMIADYELPSLNDWRAVVSKISNTKDVRVARRVRVGQYGNAATVTEGNAYLAATSPTDEEVTYSLTKRGDVETITEESILNDDLGQLASIPQRMTRGILQQIRKIVWALIDPSVNPVIYDTNVLFDKAGAHVNALAATLDLTNLNAIRALMRKKTAYNGATHELGTIPKFLCVPADLENTANQFSSSQYEPSSNLFQVANLHRGIGVIVLDHWTDVDAAVLVGDPSMIPTIEVGALDGRIEPELFTQDMPNVGSMFDSDSIKIKRKSRFGAAILDWRGFAGLIPGI